SRTKEPLKERTDGQTDASRGREGAVLTCPVKVAGGGVYLEDMHAMQANGEIAGHTTDVAGIVDLQVEVIKAAELTGPVLLPLTEDLPPLAKPFTESEMKKAKELAHKWNMAEIEESYPVSFIVTGADLNTATENGMARAALIFYVSVIG